LNANYLYAHAGLAKAAKEQGALDEAVAHCRRAVLADTQSPTHQIELGTALLAVGDVEEAVAVLEAVVKADPASARGRAELGAAQLQKRDYAAAKTSFEAALKLDPSYATAHFGLATALARLGDAAQARQHEAKFQQFRSQRGEELRGQRIAYDDDQALREDIARLYTQTAGVYLAEGRQAAAERLWRRAARLHAENRECRQALAWLSLQQKKPLETIRLLRELSQLEPASAVYPAEIARLYVELGRLDDAQRALEEFAQMAPDNPDGQRALAEFHLKLKGQPQLAVEPAKKAAELSASASDWVLLSAAHELAGDLPAAVASLEQAARLAPDNLQYRQLLALLKERAAKSPPEAAQPARQKLEADAVPRSPAPDSRN
jgi:tetratricopeptide (TPR) repeat protein